MSQCSTAAQCLKELARVMEQFGIDNAIKAVKSKYVKYEESWFASNMPAFSNPSDWSFAIAEVEGKPVFFDSILYDRNGAPYTGFRGYVTDLCTGLSFNPPKPKTIMVELLVEDIEQLSKQKVTDMCYSIQRVSTSCRQALEREGVK